MRFSPKAIFWATVLVLINLFSLVNVTSELIKVFNFKQVYEVAADFCNEDDPGRILSDLYFRSGEVIFLNFKYDPRDCFEYRAHNWLKIRDSQRSLRLGFGNFGHYLYLWFPSSPRATWQLTSSDAFSVRLYKGTADNPFTIERDVNDSRRFDLEGLYFVHLDAPEPGYSYAFTLKPAPFTDELARQMKCLKKRWFGWAKRLGCSWL